LMPDSAAALAWPLSAALCPCQAGLLLDRTTTEMARGRTRTDMTDMVVHYLTCPSAADRRGRNDWMMASHSVIASSCVKVELM
jgi:hypothetical protein